MDRSALNAVIARHEEEAHREVETAEGIVLIGQRMVADGQEKIREGETALALARARLALVQDMAAELYSAVDAERYVTAAANGHREPVDALTPDAAAHSTSVQTNGHARSPAMGEVIDEIMSDGKARTATEIHEATLQRGFSWSRRSVVNRCSERVRNGLFESVRRGAYKLAIPGGDSRPPGHAGPGGEREAMPERGSQP